MSGGSMNAVFYSDKYHPIQVGSIDGTDIAPHDNAVLRAHICSQAGLYDPFGDPKANGDPYCTVFVGRLSRQTDEDTLRKAMNKYGRVKSMRLVRDIVTGASRGYAFVEYETDREMRRAYEDAHHSVIDGNEVIVDYYRQQLMPGWIPRRLGGGLGGKKESGQLRFGGRERPFHAPLRPIPYDELKKLGIPPPPEGWYMTRFQVPPPPRRKSSNIDREDSPPRGRSRDRVDDSSHRRLRSPTEDDVHMRKSSRDRREESQSRRSEKSSITKEETRYSRLRKEMRDDDSHRKRRRSREPGEVSPAEEDGSYRRETTSTETGHSLDQYGHQRHHREHRHESSHSKHRDHRRHGHHGHSKRSESDDYGR